MGCTCVHLSIFYNIILKAADCTNDMRLAHCVAALPSLVCLTISQLSLRLNNETLPGAAVEAINLRSGTLACGGQSLSPPCK